jgi:hypothetical protein
MASHDTVIVGNLVSVVSQTVELVKQIFKRLDRFRSRCS